MDKKLFQHSPAGRLIAHGIGHAVYDAFLPHPLPPKLDSFDMEFVQLVTDASLALGELAGIGRTVPNPDFLVIPYIKREAVASSRIEGTQASLSELFYFEAAENVPKSHDMLEVTNYVNALNYGISRLTTLPLSKRLLREMHKTLMNNVRGGTPDMTPGEFRKSQNWIGVAGCTLQDATYVPPPHGEYLDNALDDLEKFLHARHNLPYLMQCALIHYQFEAIHPFLDGNGRIGRLLITLFLCEKQVLPQPLLYLSDFFEKNRDEYYARLLAVSSKGDWQGWLRFFLTGVITQSNHAVVSARKIIDKREAYRKQLQSSKTAKSTLALLDQIFINPYVTTQQVARVLNVSFNTAKNAIHALQSLGILVEATGRSRNRLYIARQLVEVISENEPVYLPES